MHIEFLVEEPSAEAALRNLLPKILHADLTFDIHPHQGKEDLLRKLPGRLRGYCRWLPRDWRISVLVDADDSDCRDLKARLERIARDAGLKTRSDPDAGSGFQVLNRLAVEELESWFFGDVQAIRGAYPRIPSSIGGKEAYRDPDAIPGGAWEALERELKRWGYHQGGLAKIAAARAISAYMEPDRNLSHSFNVFHAGLLRMADKGPFLTICKSHLQSVKTML